MRLGSEDHKLLFCRSFLDSYLDYEPENLPWPDLKGQDLEKLRSIPFWREALATEQGAGAMVTAFAQSQSDPCDSLLRCACAGLPVSPTFAWSALQ